MRHQRDIDGGRAGVGSRDSIPRRESGRSEALWVGPSRGYRVSG